jgi:hypothetical protein
MFHPDENDKPTAQPIREALFQEIEVSKQTIYELKSEELEEVIGAGLESSTVLMHRMIEAGFASKYPHDLATLIQTRIREHAEAGKTYKVSKNWTKVLTNPEKNPPRVIDGIYQL